ncbi:hypothetical protein FHS15_005779 [Paenibacillus castaneae]|uniref:hypothetical protein n=1 Tax=Paenibacillus castaneae TaxID=474957 RepID=UPI0011AF673C|nr:hypothetical protein [Paenibacillus castaneae]NIK80588.1 hypothetical protein [Paenibacillus castaneae]
MNKNIILLLLLSIFLSACSSNSSTKTSPTPSDISSSPLESTAVSETSTTAPSETNIPSPEVMTKQEIFDFDLIRSDWTKEQMAELGLKKEVNDLGGETYFSNDVVKYIYFDARSIETTPAVVDVFGDHPGPRGIRVGDTFEEVMALFPQNENWKSNANGVFYGQYDPDAEQDTWGPSGYVTQDNGNREISILTDVYPFVRLFFKDDVLTHYTFFLIAAH